MKAIIRGEREDIAKVFEQWNEPLRWTGVEPMRAGWYWIRNTNLSARIVKLIPVHGCAWLRHDYSDNFQYRYGKRWEFAGPIKPPLP